jgi:uncharacterized protein (UPF0248 family)
MTTIADVLAHIKRQLDWESRNDGEKTTVMVLNREQAEYLHRVVLDIIRERDNLVHALSQIHGLAEIATAGDAGKGSMSERLEKIWQLSS